MEAILVEKEVIINEFNRGIHISIAEAGGYCFGLHYGYEYQEHKQKKTVFQEVILSSTMWT